MTFSFIGLFLGLKVYNSEYIELGSMAEINVLSSSCAKKKKKLDKIEAEIKKDSKSMMYLSNILKNSPSQIHMKEMVRRIVYEVKKDNEEKKFLKTELSYDKKPNQYEIE